jgi:hypothetical protein
MADPAFPDVSTDQSWTLREESVETLFELPAARVRGATRRYDDAQTRAAVREVTDGLDHQWRFLTVTRLAFAPPLPSGMVLSMVVPIVRQEATRTFAQRLENRGLEEVERRGTERIRIQSNVKARLQRFGATDTVEHVSFPVTAWLGVWHDQTDFFVVTGGHPAVRIADVLEVQEAVERLQETPAEYRTDFVEQVRTVG